MYTQTHTMAELCFFGVYSISDKVLLVFGFKRQHPGFRIVYELGFTLCITEGVEDSGVEGAFQECKNDVTSVRDGSISIMELVQGRRRCK